MYAEYLLSRQDTIFVVPLVFMAASLELLSAHYKFTEIQFIVPISQRSPSGSERFIYGYQPVVPIFVAFGRAEEINGQPIFSILAGHLRIHSHS